MMDQPDVAWGLYPTGLAGTMAWADTFVATNPRASAIR